MTVLARISSSPIDPADVSDAVLSDTHGAVLVFWGVVRDHDHGRTVSALEYRAHPDAEKFLRRCCEDAADRSGLPTAAVHRVGDLAIGDTALVAAVASAHRAEAFDALQALVDRIKTEVPIWKRQHFSDGIGPDDASEWVGL
ncbi:MAG: molybdenum cofactor biosynthesis protein MoaE [Rhodococcus sp. (in: high G+C Gram-positive bacteria)]